MERDAGAEQALARLRVGHTLTRPQLARLSGVAVSTIAKAEDGIAMSAATIKALARVLGPRVYDVVPVVERNAPLRPAAPTPVAKARVERGWSQREAARRIGVSHDVLRRAELGLGVYPPNAHRIALALDLDVFEVLTPSRKANGDPAAA